MCYNTWCVADSYLKIGVDCVDLKVTVKQPVADMQNQIVTASAA